MRFLALKFYIVALLLTGCAIPKVQYVRELPPAQLLLDCPVPETRKSTNGELAQGLHLYHWALEACNNDKQALRNWASKD
jgi:hypothetical protein